MAASMRMALCLDDGCSDRLWNVIFYEVTMRNIAEVIEYVRLHIVQAMKKYFN
jgi:hypothetical protein